MELILFLLAVMIFGPPMLDYAVNWWLGVIAESFQPENGSDDWS